MRSTTEKERLVIWVSLDVYDQLSQVFENTSAGIPYDPNSALVCPPWFRIQNIKRICAELKYPAIYARSKPNLRALHQGILMAEVLRHQYPYEIIYLDSVEVALKLLATKSQAEKKSITVWLDVLQDAHPYTWMHAFDTLTHECGVIYPPREEIVWADAKIYDMKAFDRIASADGTYRPVTCYPRAQDQCLLSKSCRSILKRSHSCGAGHVKIIPENKRGIPQCKTTPLSSENDPLSDLKFYHWFHQEYVPSLKEFGEFRIFIAIRTGTNGGREPYIVHVIHTQWVGKNCEIIHDPDKLGTYFKATKVKPMTHWSDYPTLSYGKLTKYALHVYRRLQNLDEVGFQTLNVGGRLDIGIAPDGKGLFVNELTRWYGAHQFAKDTLKAPHDQVCHAFAKAFAETLGAEPRTHFSAVEPHVSAKRKVVKESKVGEPKAKARKYL